MRAKVSIARAAQLLRCTYQHTYNLLLTGELSGQQAGGRWQVDAESVERLKREREAANA